MYDVIYQCYILIYSFEYEGFRLKLKNSCSCHFF